MDITTHKKLDVTATLIQAIVMREFDPDSLTTDYQVEESLSGNVVHAAEVDEEIEENPDEEKGGPGFKAHINPNSIEILAACQVEPSLADAQPESRYQFERLGYFCVDAVDSTTHNLVFNRTVTLRDTWAKIRKAQHKK